MRDPASSSPSRSFAPLYVQARDFGRTTAWVIGLLVAFVLLTRLGESHPFLLDVALLSGFCLAAYLRWRKIRGATLRVHSDALVLQRTSRRRVFRLPAAREGWIEKDRGRVAACVKTETELVVAWFESSQDAHELLTVAGVDPERRVMEWQLAFAPDTNSLALAFGGYCALVWLIASSLGLLVLAVVTLPLLFAFVTITVLRVSSLQVGIDGILLGSVIRRRFISYAAIETVTRSEDGDELVIALRDGVRLTLAPGRLDSNDALLTSTSACGELAEILQTRLGHTSLSFAEERVAALERRNASVSEWRHRLRELTDGGYRQSSVSPDELALVLDDASATSEQRIGAALALAGIGVSEYRERLRIAVDRCAEPKLRVALEHVASGRFDDLDPLMEELSEADPTADCRE